MHRRCRCCSGRRCPLRQTLRWGRLFIALLAAHARTQSGGTAGGSWRAGLVRVAVKVRRSRRRATAATLEANISVLVTKEAAVADAVAGTVGCVVVDGAAAGRVAKGRTKRGDTVGAAGCAQMTRVGRAGVGWQRMGYRMGN